MTVRDSFRLALWAEADGSTSWEGYLLGKKVVEGHGKGKNAVVRTWGAGVEYVDTIVDGKVVNQPKPKAGGAGARLGGAGVWLGGATILAVGDANDPCASLYWRAVATTFAYEAAVIAASLACGLLGPGTGFATCVSATTVLTAAALTMSAALMDLSRCRSGAGTGGKYMQE